MEQLIKAPSDMLALEPGEQLHEEAMVLHMALCCFAEMMFTPDYSFCLASASMHCAFPYNGRSRPRAVCGLQSASQWGSDVASFHKTDVTSKSQCCSGLQHVMQVRFLSEPAYKRLASIGSLQSTGSGALAAGWRPQSIHPPATLDWSGQRGARLDADTAALREYFSQRSSGEGTVCQGRV